MKPAPAGRLCPLRHQAIARSWRSHHITSHHKEDRFLGPPVRFLLIVGRVLWVNHKGRVLGSLFRMRQAWIMLLQSLSQHVLVLGPGENSISCASWHSAENKHTLQHLSHLQKLHGQKLEYLQALPFKGSPSLFAGFFHPKTCPCGRCLGETSHSASETSPEAPLLAPSSATLCSIGGAGDSYGTLG